MLLACGDTGAGGVVLTYGIGALAVAIWLAVAALIVRAARGPARAPPAYRAADPVVVIGRGLAAYYYGLFGSDAGLGKLALIMLIPPAIAAVVAQASAQATDSDPSWSPPGDPSSSSVQ